MPMKMATPSMTPPIDTLVWRLRAQRWAKAMESGKGVMAQRGRPARP